MIYSIILLHGRLVFHQLQEEAEEHKGRDSCGKNVRNRFCQKYGKEKKGIQRRFQVDDAASLCYTDYIFEPLMTDG